MKSLKNITMVLVAAAALTVIIAGCNLGGSSANASSSSWEPYLVLKTKSTAAMAVASNAAEHARRLAHPFSSLMQEAWAATIGSPQCPGIGTILSGDSSVIGQSDYQAASCTGYLYGITSDGFIERLQKGATVWYDAANCQGSVWVSDDGVGARGQASGAFFTVDSNDTQPATATPGTYLEVTPGEARQSVNAMSGYTEGVGVCSNFGAGITVNRFEAAPNISTNSGMASAQVAGGVTVSTP